MSRDPANDARLAREEATRQAQFRAQADAALRAQQASERAQSDRFYRRMRDISSQQAQEMRDREMRARYNQSTLSSGPAPTPHVEVGYPVATGFSDAWGFISAAIGVIAGLMVWHHISRTNPELPILSLVLGAFGGYAVAKVVNSHLGRGIAKLTVYVGLAVGAWWFIFRPH